jgi:CHASE2 domain-containing sensor protein
MQEILPIASGLLLGGLLAFRRLPLYVRLLLVVVLAACATIASGEFRLSWGFLFPDLAEVAVSCAAAFFAIKAWDRHKLRRPSR